MKNELAFAKSVYLKHKDDGDDDGESTRRVVLCIRIRYV